MIILDTFSGLCNRMRAICSALELAKKKSTKLLVLWECNDDLNASFNSLFETPEEFKVISFKAKHDLRRIFYRITARNKIFDTLIKKSLDGKELKQTVVDSINLPAYVRSCEYFYDVDEYFKLFRPVKSIETKIEQIKSKFSEDMVGVHIRRTDQIKSIEYSKTENFIDLMNREIKRNSQVCFYLATDDMKEEEYLRQVFPGRIISNEERTLRRDSKEGMYDAVVDLYCLSSCRKIIGSYWSSFTDTAAAINSIEKIIAGVDN